MAAHRQATGRLSAVVGTHAQPGGRPLSDAMLDRVGPLPQSATVDAGQAERLRAGRVTEDGQQPTGSPPAPEPPRESSAAKPRKRRGETDPEAQARAERREEKDTEAEARAERRAELERRADSAAEEAGRREEATADQAGDAAEAAEREVDRLREEVRRAGR